METIENTRNETIPISDWILTLIISVISPLNIIMFFVWAFSKNTHPTKANFAKAALILYAILFTLLIIFIVIFGAAFFGMLDKEMLNTTEY